MSEKLFPKWAQTLGAMNSHILHVRSQCRDCGIEQRVDVEALCAKYGGGASLIDRTDRCSLVGCGGVISYSVSLPFRGFWIRLIRDEEKLRALDEDAAPKVNAATMRAAKEDVRIQQPK